MALTPLSQSVQTAGSLHFTNILSIRPYRAEVPLIQRTSTLQYLRPKDHQWFFVFDHFDELQRNRYLCGELGINVSANKPKIRLDMTPSRHILAKLATSGTLVAQAQTLGSTCINHGFLTSSIAQGINQMPVEANLGDILFRSSLNLPRVLFHPLCPIA